MSTSLIERVSGQPAANSTHDFIVTHHGSLILLTPVTRSAQLWVDENIPEDAQYFGRSVVIEPRYWADIEAGIQGDGLTTRS